MNTNSKVDWFFENQTKWQEAYKELRVFILECGLEEELKWGCPCYTFKEGKVVLIHGFKDYCALLFIQGALLQDTEQLLVQQTENVQAARHLRFSSVEEVLKMKYIIQSYIKEAMNNESQGLKVELKTTSEFEMPIEFQTVLNEMPELQEAFYALTPGRQRGYLLYFSSAKQSKTRIDRIEKYIPKILENKGLDD